jgi:antitoxin component of RelBE/YafQ-DinJ toxin-antitoxin module
MSRITIRLDDAVEKQIRDIAKDKGMTISEYCRNVLTESQPEQVITRATVEAEIDKLTQAQAQFTKAQITMLKQYDYNSRFFNSLFYYFMISAVDEDGA